jgi:hypothetical protein
MHYPVGSWLFPIRPLCWTCGLPELKFLKRDQRPERDGRVNRCEEVSMTAATIPANEAKRMAKLKGYEILDSRPE